MFFDYEINNFDYREGFEYIIKVIEYKIANPPQDHPSVEYYFLELVDKIEKDSENIP
ncbi:MAG: DUF4377 domain-containing protein [Tannerellaceae bacterium]|jgi:hypothetical protein|nr:DUF4377 domain-containing protein [Tannerellaceae bacterium]